MGSARWFICKCNLLVAHGLICGACAGHVAGVVDEDGTERSPGLTVNSIVAVPALSIPDSNVTVQVSTGAGNASNNVMLQVRIHLQASGSAITEDSVSLRNILGVHS